MASTNGFSTTLNGAITVSDETITLTMVAGLPSGGGILVIDRINASGTATPDTREYISYTGVSGMTITGATRGLAGSTAQAHSSGAIVEEVWSVTHVLDLISFLGVTHDSNGKTICPEWTDGTDGTTITFDLGNGVNTKHRVTLGDNRILALDNVSAGQTFMIRLEQDDVGSRTVTWFDTIKWSGGSAPTLTTTANKADLFGFIQTSTGNYDGCVVMQNI